MTTLQYVSGWPIMAKYTPPATAVNAGDVVVLNNMPYVAHLDIAVAQLGALSSRGGMYIGPADAAYAVGTFVYWNPGASQFTGTYTTACVPFGWIVAGPTGNAADGGPTGVGINAYVVHSPEGVFGTGAGSVLFPGLVKESTADGLVAHAGGGQAAGLPLTTMNSRVVTVATAGDSVKLMTSQTGLVGITITNAGANSLNVFPATGDQINSLGANAAFALAAGKTVSFYCYTAGQWHTILSA